VAIAITSSSFIKYVDAIAIAFIVFVFKYLPLVDAIAVANTSIIFIIYVDIVAEARTSSGFIKNVDTVAIAFIFRIVKWVEAVAIAWSVIVIDVCSIAKTIIRIFIIYVDIFAKATTSSSFIQSIDIVAIANTSSVFIKNVDIVAVADTSSVFIKNVDVIAIARSLVIKNGLIEAEAWSSRVADLGFFANTTVLFAAIEWYHLTLFIAWDKRIKGVSQEGAFFLGAHFTEIGTGYETAMKFETQAHFP
jgi:hypothetical protein